MPANATEQWLVNTVARQARAAGIGMPEVAVYDSPEVNAFATGPSKSRALVAVSTGLLRSMRQEEVAGVLGHEIGHVVARHSAQRYSLAQGIGIAGVVVMYDRLLAMGRFAPRPVMPGGPAKELATLERFRAPAPLAEVALAERDARWALPDVPADEAR